MNLLISIITFSLTVNYLIANSKCLNPELKNQHNKEVFKPNRSAQNIFILISKSKNKIGIINKKDIDQLSEPLRAIAAFYSAVGGSNCSFDKCGLTSALKLGNQGSQAHKNILEKWFPDDSVVKLILAQNCYQPPSGASISSEYAYLKLEKKGKIVLVHYHLIIWNKGKVNHLYAIDQYILKDHSIQSLKRHVWG